MINKSSFDIIVQIIQSKLKEKGLVACEIFPESQLLGGSIPIDSLDLATIIVEIEENITIRPFEEGFINFQTVGELAALYSPPTS